MVIRSTIMVLAVAAAACSGLPGGPGGGVLSFTATALPLGQYESTVDVTASGGTIEVRATLSAPDPCRQLSADLERRGSTLELRVSIARPPSNTVCVQVIGHYEYEARISALPAGLYDVEVVHTYVGTGWAPARTARQVQVP